MEIKSNTIKIKKVIEKIRHKEWILPKFQRDFVWSQDETKKLLDSIKNEYPIGAITLYEENEKTQLIIDGQQRLTSIWKIVKEENNEEINDYIIPFIQWKIKNKNTDNLMNHFIRMNINGKSLDNEDIFLSFLSCEDQIKKPNWFTKVEREKCKEVYKNKNNVINFKENKDNNFLSHLELIWFIKLGINFKNHDGNFFAHVCKVKEKNDKPKNIIIWIIRMISMMFANDFKDMIYTNNLDEIKSKKENKTNSHKNFQNHLKKYLENIFNSQDSFEFFIKKINYLNNYFPNKFDFVWNFPTNKSASERKVYNKLIANDYMCIYLFDFIHQNKNIFRNEFSFIRFKEEFDEYKIKAIDVINFCVKKLISAGGKNKWYEIISKNRKKLFFDKMSDKKDLKNNLFQEIKENNKKKHFNRLQKLILLWLSENEVIEKIDNKKNIWYEFDHFFPKKFFKKPMNSNFNWSSSVFANCQILTNQDNNDKASDIDFKFLSKGILSNKIKNEIREKHDWEKLESLVKDYEYDKFIEIRKNAFEKIIKNKIEDDSK